MTWRDQQQQFWSLITRPQDLRESVTQIDKLFAPHTQLSKVEALAIYNNAFHQRLLQVASEMYPVLYHTLGDEVFTQLWLGYIAEHLPRSGAMTNMGENLLSHVMAHEQFGKLPALHDIIRVESLLIELFDRADEQAFSLEQLQALAPEDWPQTVWQPKQDWALLESHFNLEQYWQDLHAHMDSGAIAGSADFGVALLDTTNPNTTQNYLLRRHQHRMQFQRISAALAVFLQAVQQGNSFAQICALLANTCPEEDIPQLSLSLLMKAIQLQLLVAIRC